MTETEVKILAYGLWVKRGRPFGSPEIDWLQAERILEREAFIEEAKREPNRRQKVLKALFWQMAQMFNSSPREFSEATPLPHDTIHYVILWTVAIFEGLDYQGNIHLVSGASNLGELATELITSNENL